MVQTIVLLLMLVGSVAFVQANISAVHSLSPLFVPGKDQHQLTYLRLLVAMGGALVLLWMAGRIDGVLRRAQIRRRDAVIFARDQELMHLKAVVYDQQRPMLADIKGRLEAVSQILRKMPARIDEASPAITRRLDARAIREMFPPTGDPHRTPRAVVIERRPRNPEATIRRSPTLRTGLTD